MSRLARSPCSADGLRPRCNRWSNCRLVVAGSGWPRAGCCTCRARCRSPTGRPRCWGDRPRNTYISSCPPRQPCDPANRGWRNLSLLLTDPFMLRGWRNLTPSRPLHDAFTTPSPSTPSQPLHDSVVIRPQNTTPTWSTAPNPYHASFGKSTIRKKSATCINVMFGTDPFTLCVGRRYSPGKKEAWPVAFSTVTACFPPGRGYLAFGSNQTIHFLPVLSLSTVT